MKRYNNLFNKICSLNNLQLADDKAQKGKQQQYGVRLHNRNAAANLLLLQQMLLSNNYATSAYTTFKVYEPKERTVYRLPYFPDRILHHAIMNVLEPIFTSCFTADTYSCIKGRGIHAAHYAVIKALHNVSGTQYCLKLDIEKFYPSINHATLKTLLNRKFKDARLLNLLYEIIDSAPGLPIGNYLSQYLANFYLTYFDHWLKEVIGVQYYFRYADDIVILSNSKQYLHNLLSLISNYLQTHLQLTVKGNYQVFPVSARGIDFVGYVHYHSHTLLRKRIKQNFARAIVKGAAPSTVASYKGWLLHCNSINLTKKLLTNE